MEKIVLASGKVITLFTGWRAALITVLFAATAGFIAIVCWESTKGLRKRRRTL